MNSVPSDAIVHLTRNTLGHAPLGTSTTMATLCGGVPGGTIAPLLSACPRITAVLSRWARVIIAGVFPWYMSIILSPATFLAKEGGGRARSDIGSRIYEDYHTLILFFF